MARDRHPITTSWAVTGLGALVTALGWILRPRNKKASSGIMGFGLAHLVLGLFDMVRPTVRNS
ncbi:MAG: hypothetical protein GX998_00050 [Firmicutes bacterium]|nr:hypothetical protein [Bacillota bacterium]